MLLLKRLAASVMYPLQYNLIESDGSTLLDSTAYIFLFQHDISNRLYLRMYTVRFKFLRLIFLKIEDK